MTTEESAGDQPRGLEAFSGYKVHDDRGEKIGKVDDLFVDENNRPEYIGVKMGFFGLSSTLIPMEIVRVNDRMKTIEVNEARNRVKDAPHFDYDDEITPDFEARVFAHFGLRSPGEERGSYGDYRSDSEEREETAPRDREREESRDRPPEEPSRTREEPRGGEAREYSDSEARDADRERGESSEGSGETTGAVEDRDSRVHSQEDAPGSREESPEYREGYDAAMREMGAEPEEPPEYREGYDAAMKEMERERERSQERSDTASEDRERREYPPEERGASSDEGRRESRPAPSDEGHADERDDEGGGMRIRKRSRGR